MVDEGWGRVGLAAEVSATIMDGAFYELDAPVARVCTADVPLPFAKHLEDAALPQPAVVERQRPDVADSAQHEDGEREVDEAGALIAVVGEEDAS